MEGRGAPCQQCDGVALTRSWLAVVAGGVAAVLLVFAGLGARSWFGGSQDDIADRVSISANGDLVQLHEVGSSGVAVRPDDFCLPNSPAVLGARVLDCQLTPLITPESTRCNSIGQPASIGRLCRPLEAVSGELLLGWVLSIDSEGKRALSVYIGAMSPGVNSPAGAASSATMERRYVAVDSDGRWAELAVCPADLDANGSVDLVLLGRSTVPNQLNRPELVVLSLGTSAAGAEAMPELQALSFDGESSRSQGEGCAGPLVRALRYDHRGGLLLDAEELAS